MKYGFIKTEGYSVAQIDELQNNIASLRLFGLMDDEIIIGDNDKRTGVLETLLKRKMSAGDTIFVPGFEHLATDMKGLAEVVKVLRKHKLRLMVIDVRYDSAKNGKFNADGLLLYLGKFMEKIKAARAAENTLAAEAPTTVIWDNNVSIAPADEPKFSSGNTPERKPANIAPSQTDKSATLVTESKPPKKTMQSQNLGLAPSPKPSATRVMKKTGESTTEDLKFESLYKQWIGHKITRQEASDVLGVSMKTWDKRAEKYEKQNGITKRWPKEETSAELKVFYASREQIPRTEANIEKAKRFYLGQFPESAKKIDEDAFEAAYTYLVNGGTQVESAFMARVDWMTLRARIPAYEFVHNLERWQRDKTVPSEEKDRQSEEQTTPEEAKTIEDNIEESNEASEEKGKAESKDNREKVPKKEQKTTNEGKPRARRDSLGTLKDKATEIAQVKAQTAAVKTKINMIIPENEGRTYGLGLGRPPYRHFIYVTAEDRKGNTDHCIRFELDRPLVKNADAKNNLFKQVTALSKLIVEQIKENKYIDSLILTWNVATDTEIERQYGDKTHVIGPEPDELRIRDDIVELLKKGKKKEEEKAETPVNPIESNELKAKTKASKAAAAQEFIPDLYLTAAAKEGPNSVVTAAQSTVFYPLIGASHIFRQHIRAFIHEIEKQAKEDVALHMSAFILRTEEGGGQEVVGTVPNINRTRGSLVPLYVTIAEEVYRQGLLGDQPSNWKPHGTNESMLVARLINPKSKDDNFYAFLIKSRGKLAIEYMRYSKASAFMRRVTVMNAAEDVNSKTIKYKEAFSKFALTLNSGWYGDVRQNNINNLLKRVRQHVIMLSQMEIYGTTINLINNGEETIEISGIEPIMDRTELEIYQGDNLITWDEEDNEAVKGSAILIARRTLQGAADQCTLAVNTQNGISLVLMNQTQAVKFSRKVKVLNATVLKTMRDGEKLVYRKEYHQGGLLRDMTEELNGVSALDRDLLVAEAKREVLQLASDVLGHPTYKDIVRELEADIMPSINVRVFETTGQVLVPGVDLFPVGKAEATAK
jgi:hypothetical protein